MQSFFDREELSQGEFLADDCNLDFPPPWFMRRDYRDDPRYQEMPGSLKPLADSLMRDGFIVLTGEVDEAVCDELVDKFQRFTRANHSYFDPHRDEFGFLQRIINLHLVMPQIFDIFASASSTLRLQDALFGGRTSVYTTLYYERGSWQPIHRDTPFFTTRPEYNYFGTWFALEDANSQNGCLQVMKGGHLIPEIDRKAFARSHKGEAEVTAIDTQLFDLYQNEVGRLCARAGLKPTEVPLKKGDVLIWHPQLPHGGSPILDRTKTRHSIVAHTVPEGCPVYQASAFFAPASYLPGTAGWQLHQRNSRSYAVHHSVDVMHVAPRSPADFIIEC